MPERSLDSWLTYIDQLHPRAIEMGLERVREVAARLDVLRPASLSVIVAGTNGKGSTAVFTETLLLEMGYTVGTTLSPHLNCFNERVRINGIACDDATLCAHFAVVEEARGDVPLTYFEFAALVALLSFRRAGVDVGILEVGLGGRLDAFNIVDADIAAVTSIGLDHMDYLGDDLEQIGREKAGVFRPGQAVVLGEAITESVCARARDLGCQVVRAGAEFAVVNASASWSFRSAELCLTDLPRGSLAPENCAIGVSVAGWISKRASPTATLERSVVVRALGRAWLPGRCETILRNDRRYILDVAHNPAAAEFLRKQLARAGAVPVAVVGSLRDKDSAGVVAALQPALGHVICVGTDGPRGLSAEELAARFPPGISHECATDLVAALNTARSLTGTGERVLVCGCFAVVGRAKSILEAESENSAYGRR